MEIVCIRCYHNKVIIDYDSNKTYICRDCGCNEHKLSFPPLPLPADYGNRNRL